MAAGRAKPPRPCGFDIVVFAQRSSNIRKRERAEAGAFEIMLKQPETYLTFRIDLAFSNLNLSHYYYLLLLKITKSG